jgi:hypothetical protein
VANWTLSGTAKIETMSEEFSWQDNEAVIIKRTDAIAVYTNHDGDIVVIRQEGMGLGDNPDDQIVIIPRERAQDVIAVLSKELVAER